MKAAVLIAMMVVGLGGRYAQAEVPITHLANSDNWSAFFDGHCYLAEATAFLSFQNKDDFVVMVLFDRNWSLPKYVKGAVAISVGHWTASLKSDGNDQNKLIYIINRNFSVQLFDAMQNSDAINVTVGRALPRPISLIDSKETIEAFRRCAGIPDTPPNPFE